MQTEETKKDPELIVAWQFVHYSRQTFAVFCSLELLALFAEPRAQIEQVLAYAGMGVYMFVVLVFAWRWRSTLVRFGGLCLLLFGWLNTGIHSITPWPAWIQLWIVTGIVLSGLFATFRRVVVRFARLEPVGRATEIRP